MAMSTSVAELKRRARELGVEIPSNVEKPELIRLLDGAEQQRRCGATAGDAAMRASAMSSSGGAFGAPRSVAELKARLVELGIEVPSYIVEKKDLQMFVTEAERHLHRKRTTLRPQNIPCSPQPKVRFRNHAGQIPPPWYQKESRSKPGNFYFVNADTGETTWELPQVAAPKREAPPVLAEPPPPPPSADAERPRDPPSPAHLGGVGEAHDAAAPGTAAADAAARHDYRDDGFGDSCDLASPAEPSDRRWSRQGTMSARRDEETERIKELKLAQVLPPEAADWDPDTTISPLSAGTIKGSRFNWVRGKMIGRGSLGRVFKALDQTTGQILAVKEVPVDMKSEADHKFIEDLRNEVAIMQELSHPNIVRYLGHDFMDNSFYMYLEHMPGGSLTQALQQFGPFDEALLAEYAKQILNGLDYLHTRDPPVVHRDIKGPNILVGADCRVKLADFGCAKRTQETMTHTMRGSMHWMAPEVISHERYGRAADIWSFGCVAIEMGTAKVPWGRLDNPMAAVIKIGMSEETPPLPEGLSPTGEAFISLCVQRDASLRPTATEMLQHDFVKDIPLPE